MTKRKKHPKQQHPQRRGREKSKPAAKREEKAIIDTDRLLEEVEETNEDIADPAERERVIPSRPC